MTKALFLDLDNTIYPVHSIGAQLFAPLFDLIDQSGEVSQQRSAVQEAIQRKPFQVVAREFGFSPALTASGIQLLQDVRYTGPISAFPDFSIVASLPQMKFLVTTGFRKLQESKIDGLQIRQLFQEIHIVDPMISGMSKKDVFADLIQRFSLTHGEVLVIGDDPHSEIKAALDLGLPTILYDAVNLHPEWTSTRRITNYNHLPQALM